MRRLERTPEALVLTAAPTSLTRDVAIGAAPPSTPREQPITAPAQDGPSC